ncbi:hypothetical protein ABB37_05076 [Leptomonas pyrrhocoris]|uniref:Uncharacterized protein n=1 Tax=Leptomonas pyrrhocoris TaxID=157538 RepID=A0A0M9G122_LEPPY|nr:hypothetical protein ABB37_05076 [Leptomonas pyrrhocoris]KPA80063.1 hypothetical protein ABB37_05076 [Leptomonas pyrrhocoris]|eukprot:XP_015658502.1 hypothetical protein ABB37_05076 [Leptomonas pyrrhocoris]
MFARSAVRSFEKESLLRSVPRRAFAAVLRRSATTTVAANPIAATAVAAPLTLCATKRFENTTSGVAGASGDDRSTQLNDLMDSFGEARELIKDASESVGTTYFADDMADAETQVKDVLKRWADVQALLEKSGKTAELQKLRNMHELKMKQMEAELETVREAGGSG